MFICLARISYGTGPLTWFYYTKESLNNVQQHLADITVNIEDSMKNSM